MALVGASSPEPAKRRPTPCRPRVPRVVLSRPVGASFRRLTRDIENRIGAPRSAPPMRCWSPPATTVRLFNGTCGRVTAVDPETLSMAAADLPDLHVARVRRWCDVRVPVHARDRIRIECDVAPRHLTILECRPPWREDLGPEWTRFPIARLRYTKTSKTWSLLWRDRNLRFHEYSASRPPHASMTCCQRSTVIRPPSSGGSPSASPARPCDELAERGDDLA